MSAAAGEDGALDPAALARMLAQLEDSQWRRPEALRAWQLEQATALLRHAVARVPHYAPLAARLPAGDSPLDEAAWQSLPLLSRQTVQRLGDSLRADTLAPAHLPLGRLVTSGSTGSPLTVHTSALTRLFWNALTLREHRWHGRDFAGRLAAIRYRPPGAASYPEGAHAPSWGPPADRLFETGPSVVLNVQTDVARQLEWLRRVQPDYLLTYPSNALELARHLDRRGAGLPGLRELRLFGEAVDREQTARCASAFQAPVTDMYSANETGYLALQCPEQRAYHVQSEGVLLEVLDAEGRPCPPGRTGRVVVTTLWNHAMPLIRYDIGDWAEPGPPCACGRGLPVLARILGRTRNLLTLPNGERRWPALGVAGMRSTAPVLQCQIVQPRLDTLEVRLVVERPLEAAEEQALRAGIRERAGHPFELLLSYHQELERGPGGKFEEFKSLLG